MNIIDGNTVIAIRKEINAALAAIGAKHGAVIEAGRAGYTDDTISFKLEVKAIRSGVVVSKELLDLRHLYMHGLTDDQKMVPFTAYGDKWVLTGYRSKCYARPFLAKRFSDGKIFKLPVPVVYKAFNLPVS